MKYRMLWGSAVAGVVLHLGGLGWDVGRGSSGSGLGSPPQLLILAGMALTAAGLFGVALLWMYDRGLGGTGVTGLVFRSVAVPSVALVAARRMGGGARSRGGVVTAKVAHSRGPN